MTARPGSSLFSRGGWWVIAQIPVLLLALLVPAWSSGAAMRPPHFFQWLGVGMGILGCVLISTGFLALGRGLTPLPEPRDGAILKTRGVYAYLRHPIYAGLIAASIGWALWRLSAWGLVYGVVVAVFFDRKAAYEERFLRARFGGYKEYAKRVRRFIPRVY